LVSLISAIVLPLVGFLKVRLFIRFYGSDLNGLQITAANVITFLNICEVSYSLAFRQLLFKPLAENNREKVLQIYHGARKIFRITGFVVLGAGLAVALVFPFFADSPLDYIQTAGMFLLLAIPYGLSYFLMGPNFVIIADQKEYKVNIWIQTIAIVRMFLMILVIVAKMPFIWIILIEGVNVFGSNVVARHIALKTYPWLKEQPKVTDDVSFQKNAKYAVIQRLSTLATTNTDNIVITLFMGYTMTSVYGNYSYLTDAVTKIIQSTITAPMNSFGNLFNDPTADKYEVFTEFFNFACYIASIISVCLFIVMPQFVDIWLEHNALYQVPVAMALLFALNVFYLTIREPVIISRDANGLYVDAKNNAYLMAVSKIVLSVILVQKMGIMGVLAATMLTNWTVDFLYNPRLVYKRVFKVPPIRYYMMVFSRLGIAAVVGFFGYLGWNHFITYVSGGFIHFVIGCLILGICVMAVVTLIYALSYRSFRNLAVRLQRVLQRRRANKESMKEEGNR
jgi:O-antigen/teichoic acid export membrane protein